MREFRTHSILSVTFKEAWVPVGCAVFNFDDVERPIGRELQASGIGEFAGHTQYMDGTPEKTCLFLARDDRMQEAKTLIQDYLQRLGAPADTKIEVVPKP